MSSSVFFRGDGGQSASSVWLAQRLTRAESVLCQEGILSERDFVRKEFCQEGILPGRILSARDFVRKGFCQGGILSGRDCQGGILSGRDFVRKGFCQEWILSARRVALPCGPAAPGLAALRAADGHGVHGPSCCTSPY